MQLGVSLTAGGTATRRRQADRADNALCRAPAARTIARLLTVGRDRLSRSETVTVAAIEDGVPLLVEARETVAAFQVIVRTRSLDALEPWLERAKTSLVASFANGVLKDKAAVTAAITSPWSNGQTEGQITKLKLVKRQMYGRGKLDLLQARVIGATWAWHHQNRARAPFGRRYGVPMAHPQPRCSMW